MRFGFLLFFISSLTGTTGCQRSSAHSILGSPRSAYIKAVYSAPVTLDPAQMNDGSSLVASNLLYDGLLSFTPTLGLRNELAESWTTSPDGHTFRFVIRKGAKFHDGTEITADDVTYSFKRLISSASKVYSYYDCILGAKTFHDGKSKTVAGLRAIDKNTLEIELETSFPPFLSVLAGATAKVLPTNCDKDPTFFDHPIGSGAFRLVSSEKPASDFVFERFKQYSGTQAHLDKIILRPLSEADAISKAQTGEVNDLTNFPLKGSEAIFAQGRHLSSPVAATWIIGLNARKEPFRSRENRAAFRDSLDAEAFRMKFFSDAIPAHGYIPPGLPGYVESSNEKPKSLAPLKTSITKPIQIAIPSVLAQSQEMKNFLEAQFRSHGWDVEVIPTEWNKLMAGYSDHSLQAFLVSMNMDYPDTEFLVRNFESTNGDNFSGIKNTEIDKLIHLARATPDRVARHKIYAELVGKLHDEAVTIDLFYPRGHYWVSKNVEGFEPNLIADYYTDYRIVSFSGGHS